MDSSEYTTVSDACQTCHKCRAEKSFSEFAKNKRRTNGYNKVCKACHKAYLLANKEHIAAQRKPYMQQYSRENKEKIRAQRAAYYDSHRAERLAKQTAYRQTERGRVIRAAYVRSETYKEKDKYYRTTEQYQQKKRAYVRQPEVKHRTNIRQLERYRTSPMHALNTRMSAIIRLSLKGGKRGRHWETLVGYTVDDLRRYLQRQFTDGMTWDAFLRGKIHIDHIIPRSSFSYTSVDDLQFQNCWALSNLRPMWAIENWQKYTHILPGQLPLLHKGS